MTTARHRKPKNHHKREENNFINEALEPELRNGNSSMLMFILLIFIVVGGTTIAWFCYEQQQIITNLTENLTGMQMKMVKFQTFQEEMMTKNVQLQLPEGFDERLHALEGAYAQARRQVEMAVAAAEQLKSSDLRGQVVSLHTEMMVRMSDLELSTVSMEQLEGLQEVIKSKTEEFQALKENLSEIANTNSVLAENVEGLSASFASAETKVGEQAMLVDTLTSQLEGQFTELMGLKETLTLHRAQLETSAQEIASVKGLLVTEQAKRSQNIGEQLSFLRQSLDDQNRDTLSLHSSLKEKLDDIQSQLQNGNELHSPIPETVQVEQLEELSSLVLNEKHIDPDELELQEEQVGQEIQEDQLGQEVESQEEKVEQVVQEELLEQEAEYHAAEVVQDSQGEEVEQEVQGEEFGQEVQGEDIRGEDQMELGVQDEEVEQEVQAGEMETDSEHQEEQEDLAEEHHNMEEQQDFITSEQECKCAL